MVEFHPLRFAAIRAELQHVDDLDVLERVRGSAALQAALIMSRPQNWWGSGVGAEKLLEIAKRDGIPVAWVPRAVILRELAAALDADSTRFEVLKDRAEDIFDDCVQALNQCTDPWLQPDLALARQVMSAYSDGHPEAAMSHAVVVTERLAVWASTSTILGFDSAKEHDAWMTKIKKMNRYKLAELELERAGSGIDHHVPWKALAAPIPTFFTGWYPDCGDPLPSQLSRHAVVHSPSTEQYDMPNPLIAIMLMVSILRAQEDWAEEVHQMDNPGA